MMDSLNLFSVVFKNVICAFFFLSNFATDFFFVDLFLFFGWFINFYSYFGYFLLFSLHFLHFSLTKFLSLLAVSYFKYALFLNACICGHTFFKTLLSPHSMIYFQCLYQFPEAAVTNYHKLRGLNNRNILSQFWKSGISIPGPKSGRLDAPSRCSREKSLLSSSNFCWSLAVFGLWLHH